jgi:polyhydroxyalkanoate synthesis regulator protein
MTVDGVPVKRTSFDSKFGNFANTQIRKLVENVSSKIGSLTEQQQSLTEQLNTVEAQKSIPHILQNPANAEVEKQLRSQLSLLDGQILGLKKLAGNAMTELSARGSLGG